MAMLALEEIDRLLEGYQGRKPEPILSQEDIEEMMNSSRRV